MEKLLLILLVIDLASFIIHPIRFILVPLSDYELGITPQKILWRPTIYSIIGLVFIIIVFIIIK